MVDKIGGRAMFLLPVPPRISTHPTPTTTRALARDDAHLSDRARELSLARQALQATPPIRAERVEALRQRIQAGTYYVPDALLAQKILDFRA